MRNRPQAVYSQKECIVVFDGPMDGVAGQSIRAGERGDSAIVNSIKTTLGCGPQRPIPIELKTLGQRPRQPFARWYTIREADHP